MTTPLAPWPEIPDADSDLFVESPDAAWLLYERAVAAAWEARARLAVEALDIVALCDPDVSDEVVARRAIRAIGPLPPLPDLPAAEKGE